MIRFAAFITSVVLLSSGPAHAGPVLDFIRSYDLNDYSLGLSVSTSQNPYSGAPDSTIAYPYLTSFTHSAFTNDWFLIRGENIGFRYVTQSDWELGFIGRVQTLGLGGGDNDELSGLEERRWAVEAGPLIGWRRWPVHVQFRSYWDIPSRHGGTTSELEFSVPFNLERGYFVPGIKITRMSDDYSNYYFGVSETEITPSRPAYAPGAVTNTWVGFTLGYELTPQWLLSTTAGLEFLDSAVTASPIVDRDQLWSVSLGLAYRADLFEPSDIDDNQQQQAIEIRLSAISSSITTEVSRDAADGQPGDKIDLEDFLGVADKETIIQIDTLFRVGYYHRFELGYFELRRRGQKTLLRDIDFGGETFPAGTDIETFIGSEVLRFAYSYSLMRDSQKELGVTAGLSYARFETGLVADATQQSERAIIDAVLPTIGMFGSVALGRKWRLSADSNVFALDFDRFDGYMGYLNLSLDRRFGDRINVGFGYNFYGTRLSAKNEELRGTFRMRHHGPKLTMGFVF